MSGSENPLYGSMQGDYKPDVSKEEEPLVMSQHTWRCCWGLPGHRTVWKVTAVKQLVARAAAASARTASAAPWTPQSQHCHSVRTTVTGLQPAAQ